MLKLIRTVHGQSLWVALVAILTTTPTSADETFDFSLAAQPLQEALVEFSRTTRRQVSADSVYIEGLESNQVSGRLAPDQALGQMIAGTGLNLVTVNNRSFALRPAATVAAASTTAGASGSARIVEEMIVQGQRVSAFRVADTSTASLFDMPIEETPFNVGVVTQELIADQQIFTLEEAVKNSASVNASRTHSRNAPSYSIRGFGLNSDRSGFLINGVPIAGGNAPPAHVSALERIEVLKGSTALFYGAGEPAGVINYVYKTPQADSAYAVSATIGQFDDYRVELDATGQVGTEKLLYRFTLGWQDSQGAINYDYNETVAPTLQLLWNISDRTSLRFIGEYVSTETNP
ncbi:MAG: TonB-dependent receptor, partial [Pseudomonadota bacterium]